MATRGRERVVERRKTIGVARALPNTLGFEVDVMRGVGLAGELHLLSALVQVPEVCSGHAQLKARENLWYWSGIGRHDMDVLSTHGDMYVANGDAVA